MRNPRVDVVKQQSQGCSSFYIACQEGRREVVSLLLADTRIDPNRPDNEGTTPFFMAAQEDHKEVVSLLLAYPGIDPDQPENEGVTPFLRACCDDSKELVSLLLADPRIDPNRPKNSGATPLWLASQEGRLGVVQHILASGRKIDTRTRSSFNKKTAAEQGRRVVPRGVGDTEEDQKRKKTNGPLCADLIDEYERDPVAAGNRLRRLPGVREHFVGHLFALVIFHSDSFTVINERTASSDTRRFLKIASRLPLEIQMVLCNRIFGSSKDIILSKYSEPYFKCLARTTTWQQ